MTTKYTLFVAASNFAISYVTALDGRASGFRGLGARASITFDGLITFAGISVRGGALPALPAKEAPARDRLSPGRESGRALDGDEEARLGDQGAILGSRLTGTQP